jgi:endonuclease G, mitochondrial
MNRPGSSDFQPHHYSQMEIPEKAKQQAADRIAASQPERELTRQWLEKGDILAANNQQRVESRKDRLLRVQKGATTLSATARTQLADHSVAESTLAVQRDFEAAIGGNDSLLANYLAEGSRVRRTVGRIHIRNARGRIGWGTGFLVGPELLLTNQHVLKSLELAENSLVQFDYEEDSTGNIPQTAIFKLLPQTLFVSNPVGRGLDFALVAVNAQSEPRPGSIREVVPLLDYGHNILHGELGKLLKGEAINIIHHPEEQTRRISIRQNTLTAIDTDVLENTWMHYETDTEPGSSGAPLFNDQWEVVGLHHAAVQAVDAGGQIIAKSGVRWTPDMGEKDILWAANEGLRISRFLKAVQEQVNAVMNNNAAGPVKDIVSARGKTLFDQMMAKIPPAPAPANTPVSRESIPASATRPVVRVPSTDSSVDG